eukprot:TRINITY_DN36478_c0_g1_i1.p2 TRINITY_DN36478_c0_g1~~TRINITY_DN36478_c0_g1_i1.p2  ORF type:complete len:192 (+),score=87.36 TRINITY_DN36478_c0_g1_i1:74-577(+)
MQDPPKGLDLGDPQLAVTLGMLLLSSAAFLYFLLQVLCAEGLSDQLIIDEHGNTADARSVRAEAARRRRRLATAVAKQNAAALERRRRRKQQQQQGSDEGQCAPAEGRREAATASPPPVAPTVAQAGAKCDAPPRPVGEGTAVVAGGDAQSGAAALRRRRGKPRGAK